MDKVWVEIISSLGFFGIMVLAFGWVAIKLIEHYMAKDVETYKINLNQKSEKEIEHFKAHLEEIVREHSVRYNKLHEKRVEAISELYVLLEDAHENATIFNLTVSIDVTGDKVKRILAKREHLDIPKEDAIFTIHKMDEAIEAYQKILQFKRFFRKHQLYFSKELSDQVKKLISILEEVPTSYMVADSKHEVMEVEKALQIWDDQEEVVNQTLEVIEDEFRRILGSEEKRTFSSDEKT